MKKRYFEFIETETLKNTVELRDSFEFRNDKKHKWLQRVCFFILRKIGAYRLYDELTFKKHLIDTDYFMEQLFRQKEYILREFNRKPEFLLIGSEDYANMMESDEFKQMVQFNTSYHFGRQILGLTVIIIPWMRGIIVMPKGH